MIKRITLSAFVALSLVSGAYAGADFSKDSKQAVATETTCNWYADREWNVGVWDSYSFTGNDYADDRYIEADHAWGGGVDLKYFFHRYFGLGIEGSVLDATRTRRSLLVLGDSGGNQRAIGTIVGTLTLRYPIACSRFAPFVFAGGGAAFGGGERDQFVVVSQTIVNGEPVQILGPEHQDSRIEALGQFGGGFEVRLTRRIGLINDFTWNVLNGADNNFGMVRAGINFAF